MLHRRFAFVAALALGSAAVSAQAELRYRVQRLHAPPGAPADEYMAPVAINNVGEVVANASSWGSMSQKIYLFGHGGVQRLPGSDQFAYPYASDLNDRGQIVGGILQPAGAGIMAYLYSKGRYEDLSKDAPPYGNYDRADAINAAGQVTGSIKDRAFIHQDGRTRFIDIPGAVESRGYAINDRGMVAGMATMPLPVGFETIPFIYDGSKTQFLVRQNFPGMFVSHITGLNNRGQIAVYGPMDYYANRSFIYENGAYKDIGDLGNGVQGTFIRALNEKGWGVGSSYEEDYDEASQAFLYRGGKMLNLNDLIGQRDAARWNLTDAVDINDRGQILGTGYTRDWKPIMYLATPVPEAGSWALLLLGGGVVGVAVRRRQAAAAAAA